jgi:hypothetical protein
LRSNSSVYCLAGAVFLCNVLPRPRLVLPVAVRYRLGPLVDRRTYSAAQDGSLRGDGHGLRKIFDFLFEAAVAYAVIAAVTYYRWPPSKPRRSSTFWVCASAPAWRYAPRSSKTTVSGCRSSSRTRGQKRTRRRRDDDRRAPLHHLPQPGTGQKGCHRARRTRARAHAGRQVKALVADKGFRRFLKTTRGDGFVIDRAKIEGDARFDGLFVPAHQPQTASNRAQGCHGSTSPRRRFHWIPIGNFDRLCRAHPDAFPRSMCCRARNTVRSPAFRSAETVHSRKATFRGSIRSADQNVSSPIRGCFAWQAVHRG